VSFLNIDGSSVILNVLMKALNVIIKYEHGSVCAYFCTLYGVLAQIYKRGDSINYNEFEKFLVRYIC
jgi:hypothetical protein